MDQTPFLVSSGARDLARPDLRLSQRHTIIDRFSAQRILHVQHPGLWTPICKLAYSDSLDVVERPTDSMPPF